MKFLDGRAREIAAIDVEDFNIAMALHIIEEALCWLVLAHVRRLHGRGKDQAVHHRNVPLVAVDSFRSALTTVAHLGVDGRHTEDRLFSFRRD